MVGAVEKDFVRLYHPFNEDLIVDIPRECFRYKNIKQGQYVKYKADVTVKLFKWNKKKKQEMKQGFDKILEDIEKEKDDPDKF